MTPRGHKAGCRCLACSPPSVAARLAANRTLAANGCWLWTGARFGDSDYGSITVGNKAMLVHRVAYEHFVGPIPEGHSVLHSCDTPPCFNPGHLFTGTQLDNMRDRNAKGRDNNFWRNRTHCSHGHEYTPENTRIDPRRGRVCRTCHRNEKRNRRAA